MRISDWSSDVCSSDLALIGVCGLVGLLSSAGTWAVVWAGVIVFASAFILIWTLALPPMIAARDVVHRMSAAVFTIGYLFASPARSSAGPPVSFTGREVPVSFRASRDRKDVVEDRSV